MQRKIVVKYHYTSTRTPEIKDNIKCVKQMKIQIFTLIYSELYKTVYKMEEPLNVAVI